MKQDAAKAKTQSPADEGAITQDKSKDTPQDAPLDTTQDTTKPGDTQSGAGTPALKKAGATDSQQDPALGAAFENLDANKKPVTDSSQKTCSRKKKRSKKSKEVKEERKRNQSGKMGLREVQS